VEGYFLNAEHLSHINHPLTVVRAQELIDEATKSTREKSIEALVNIRTEAAIRERKGGVAHNAGALAIKAASDYDADPVKWRRGKIVLRSVVGLIQAELKRNPNVLVVTQHLKDPVLEGVRRAIWPPAPSERSVESVILPPWLPPLPPLVVPEPKTVEQSKELDPKPALHPGNSDPQQG